MLPKQVPKHYWSLEDNAIDLGFSRLPEQKFVFVADARNKVWIVNRREGTRDAFQRKHLQGRSGNGQTHSKACPTSHTASAICYRIAQKGPVRWRRSHHSGEDERHAVRIVLLRGEFFQETRNSLTIEVTTTGKLLFALRRFQVGINYLGEYLGRGFRAMPGFLGTYIIKWSRTNDWWRVIHANPWLTLSYETPLLDIALEKRGPISSRFLR
jgi:hypothetical protein